MAVNRNLPTLKITTLKGGRNSFDPPTQIADIQCQVALNQDFWGATVAQKRHGSTAIAITGGTPFSGNIASMFRFVPGASESAMELFAVDTGHGSILKRLAAGTSWADVSLDDAISTTPQEIYATTFNGKLFMAYDSAVDRLHVYDPAVGKVRRDGLGQPAVPTTGAPSGGAVTDTRTYKIAWTKQASGVTTMRSELSVATAAVPLAAQQVVITKSTAPGEGETHWELYAASTDGLYYLMATTVIGTATATDNNAAIATTTPAPTVGINTVFPSVKYLTSDGNRIYGAGAWESGGKNARVYFSPVLGDNNIGDDERYVNSVTQKNYVDFNENDGGYVTGLSPAMDGSIYVFKFYKIYKMVPTGDINTPFLVYQISNVVGCPYAKSITIAEDTEGRPALYFCSQQGPYRYGVNGLEFMGHDVADFFPVPFLSTSRIDAFAIYYPMKRQWWLFVRTQYYQGTTALSPTSILVLNIPVGVQTVEGVKGGWVVYDGDLGTSLCAVMFSRSIGATMDTNLVPFTSCTATSNPVILQFDGNNALTDGATGFTGTVQTKDYALAGDGNKFGVSHPIIVLTPSNSTPNATVTVTMSRDAGVDTVSQTVTLTRRTDPNESGAARIRVKLERLQLSGCQTINFTITEAVSDAATNLQWKVDELIVPYYPEESAVN